MTQTISLDTRIAKDILTTLKDLKREVASLRQKLEEEPPYGSKLWWEWSERKASEDIRAGRVVRFDSVEKAIKWLNS